MHPDDDRDIGALIGMLIMGFAGFAVGFFIGVAI